MWGVKGYVKYFQLKLSGYDKQHLEQSVEQRILQRLDRNPLPNGNSNAEFIDVDIVRGSVFFKSKPRHGWMSAVRLGLLRVAFAPFYYDYWLSHTSHRVAIYIMLHFALQFIQVVSFLLTDPQTSKSTQDDVIIPCLLALLLGILHAHIIASHPTDSVNKHSESSSFMAAAMGGQEHVLSSFSATSYYRRTSSELCTSCRNPTRAFGTGQSVNSLGDSNNELRKKDNNVILDINEARSSQPFLELPEYTEKDCNNVYEKRIDGTMSIGQESKVENLHYYSKPVTNPGHEADVDESDLENVNLKHSKASSMLIKSTDLPYNKLLAPQIQSPLRHHIVNNLHESDVISRDKNQRWIPETLYFHNSLTETGSSSCSVSVASNSERLEVDPSGLVNLKVESEAVPLMKQKKDTEPVTECQNSVIGREREKLRSSCGLKRCFSVNLPVKSHVPPSFHHQPMKWISFSEMFFAVSRDQHLSRSELVDDDDEDDDGVCEGYDQCKSYKPNFNWVPISDVKLNNLVSTEVRKGLNDSRSLRDNSTVSHLLQTIDASTGGHNSSVTSNKVSKQYGGSFKFEPIHNIGGELEAHPTCTFHTYSTNEVHVMSSASCRDLSLSSSHKSLVQRNVESVTQNDEMIKSTKHINPTSSLINDHNAPEDTITACNKQRAKFLQLFLQRANTHNQHTCSYPCSHHHHHHHCHHSLPHNCCHQSCLTNFSGSAENDKFSHASDLLEDSDENSMYPVNQLNVTDVDQTANVINNSCDGPDNFMQSYRKSVNCRKSDKSCMKTNTKKPYFTRFMLTPSASSYAMTNMELLKNSKFQPSTINHRNRLNIKMSHSSVQSCHSENSYVHTYYCSNRRKTHRNTSCAKGQTASETEYDRINSDVGSDLDSSSGPDNSVNLSDCQVTANQWRRNSDQKLINNTFECVPKSIPVKAPIEKKLSQSSIEASNERHHSLHTRHPLRESVYLPRHLNSPSIRLLDCTTDTTTQAQSYGQAKPIIYDESLSNNKADLDMTAKTNMEQRETYCDASLKNRATSSRDSCSSRSRHLPNATKSTVRCYLWTGDKMSKYNLTMLDIGKNVIHAVERQNVATEYIILGCITTLLLPLLSMVFHSFTNSSGTNLPTMTETSSLISLPKFCTQDLYNVTMDRSGSDHFIRLKSYFRLLSNSIIGVYSHALCSLLKNIWSHTIMYLRLLVYQPCASTSEINLLHIFSLWRHWILNWFTQADLQGRLVIVLGPLLRLNVYGAIFFFLCIAERTFQQRLLYAKYFYSLTSCRRALKYRVPQFRLNKIEHIRCWLVLRSYLKKRGPQRSVEIIITAAFYIVFTFGLSLCSQLVSKPHGSVFLQLTNWDMLGLSFGIVIFLHRFILLGTKIAKKYRNFSVLITEQINLYLSMEKKPHKKEELMITFQVLRLVESLLKEVDGPFRICGWSLNPLVYNVFKFILLSCFSTLLSESLGFKLKLYKLKLSPSNW